VTRLQVAGAIAFFLFACNLFKKAAPDAGAPAHTVEPVASSAPADASFPEGGLGLLGFGEPDDEEELDAGCPQPVHPGYCRNRCKDFSWRQAFPHARRVKTSAGVAFGKCGAFDVFAERQRDGGAITEYYDSTGTLQAAADTRQKCGKYGKIPTCTPKLVWRDAGAPTGLSNLK